MDGMTQSSPLPPALTEAVEAMVQERVVAALAGEKESRLALMAQTDADAYARGYGQALTDMEAAWGGAMQGLWSGREKPAGWPWDGGPVWSQQEVAGLQIRALGPRPGSVVPVVAGEVVHLNRIKPHAPTLSDWDRALVEQGADAPGQRPPAEKPHSDPIPLPTATNLYGWPPAVLAVIRRQYPRFVTDREIQNEVEAILLETAPRWKINAQAKAMGLERAPMPRLAKGTKVVEVTWHQAAMLARLYGQTFTGDMIALNQARLSDSRLPCRLTQPDGPTVADVDKYGPATL